MELQELRGAQGKVDLEVRQVLKEKLDLQEALQGPKVTEDLKDKKVTAVLSDSEEEREILEQEGLLELLEPLGDNPSTFANNSGAFIVDSFAKLC